MRYKDGDANVRSVWLCSRNDAIGNVAVMVAAVAVWGTRPHGPTSWLRRSWRDCSSTRRRRSSRSQEPSSDGHVPQAPTARCFLTRPNSNLPSAPDDDAHTGQSYGDTRQIPGRGRYTVDVPQPQ